MQCFSEREDFANRLQSANQVKSFLEINLQDIKEQCSRARTTYWNYEVSSKRVVNEKNELAKRILMLEEETTRLTAELLEKADEFAKIDKSLDLRCMMLKDMHASTQSEQNAEVVELRQQKKILIKEVKSLRKELEDLKLDYSQLQHELSELRR